MSTIDRFGAWLASKVRAYRIHKREQHLGMLRSRMKREGLGDLTPFVTEERIFGNKLGRAKPERESGK